MYPVNKTASVRVSWSRPAFGNDYTLGLTSQATSDKHRDAGLSPVRRETSVRSGRVVA